METYNYDDPNAIPDYTQEGSVTPSVSENSSQVPIIPGFVPSESVTPSPSSGTVSAIPSVSFGSGSGLRCINCSGPAVWPNYQPGILWTWGTLSPFFSTTSDIAHVRFYNAAAIREPLDIYLNGRLLVSDLGYMNYTRYLHIIPGVYRLTVYRRTAPGVPILDTGVQFRGGNSYTVTILGMSDSFSVQIMTS